jgi:hypothetical protein
MALNHVLGEMIGDLGGAYRVAPVAKWQDTELWSKAAEAAAEAFLKSGSLWPVQFTGILVQEYPITNKLAFVFEATVRNAPMLYPYVWELQPEVISEFVNTGRWQRHQEH